MTIYRADSRLAPSQWETLFQGNAVSCWLGANLESALIYVVFNNCIKMGLQMSKWLLDKHPNGRNMSIYLWYLIVLTHWGWDKKATIFQTTFSNAFSWMKMYKIRLRFHRSLCPRVQLDMSTARRRLQSPQSLSSTSAHPTMVTLVNIMVMNGWLTSFTFHVNRPSHSWDKAISDFDLKISTPGSRSWVWSRARSYNRPSIILTQFVFISHRSDQQFLR